MGVTKLTPKLHITDRRDLNHAIVVRFRQLILSRVDGLTRRSLPVQKADHLSEERLHFSYQANHLEGLSETTPRNDKNLSGTDENSMVHARSVLLLVLLLCGLPSLTCAQTPLWTGIIAPTRAVDWSNAGALGGVPSTSWTQCGSTITAYGTNTAPASPTTINDAIAACGPNQFVQLGAGTFYLSSGILINSHNSVEIRGMGANQTVLVFSGSNGCQGTDAAICFQSSDTNWKNGPSNGPVNWTAGYSQGSTSITLASVPNLVVGDPIILDQEDDACASGCPGTTDTGTVYVCSDSTLAVPCSLQDNNGGAQRLHRNQVQIVTVTGCGSVTTSGSTCSGTNVTVTISPGIYMSNWSSAKSPQAWWATHPIVNVGLQNVALNLTNAGFSPGVGVGIEFFNALNGWVQGVETIDGSRSEVQVQYGAHITVRNSYFFLTQFSTSTSYGFECYTASDNLVENNIFQGMSGPLTVNGACSGTVLGYNFDINNYYTSSPGYVNAMSNVHTAGTDSLLYEGNVGPQIYGDNFHGTHNLVTIFRNYLSGDQPACWLSGSTYATSSFGQCTNDLTPLSFLSYSRFFNVIGNVLGQAGVQSLYQTTGQSSPWQIYILGGGITTDPNVESTLLRWGNYDTVTGAVRWCGNSSDPGWSTTCQGNSEVPTALSGAQALYSNPVPSTQTLPKSFYYSSEPAWWPSNKPWPPIGPDVAGGNISGVGGFANTIPAEDCYLSVMGGASNGTGGPYAFAASACYQAQTTGSAPQPPTNLSATVN